MTGRRSHGRLSALNGVVHQGTQTPVLADALLMFGDRLLPAGATLGRIETEALGRTRFKRKRVQSAFLHD